MTLAAADHWFGNRSLHLLAVRGYLNPALQCGPERPNHVASQSEEFAGIGLQYLGGRAGLAKVGAPALLRRLYQATFLDTTPPEVIAVEILALFARRCSHPTLNPTQGTTRSRHPERPAKTSTSGDKFGRVTQTRVTYSPVRVSTRMTSPTLTNCGHCT
jgi:hypothetical protein